MKTISSVIGSRTGQRSVEIVVIMLLMLLLFSVGGAPMILLSTFTPAWQRDDSEQEKVDGYGIDVLEASLPS